LSSDSPPLLGAIEAGGTKYVCAVAHSPTEILRESRFPTGDDPAEAVTQALAFFAEATKTYGKLASLGIGTFGPAALDPASPNYGSILTTPKPGWSGFPLLSELRKSLGDVLPIAFETDVNAAVIGESRHGAGQGVRHVAYITIGTGIGAAYLHDGTLLKGRMHPEVGHIMVPDYDRAYGKNTQGCGFHESCFEGRASGPAIQARWDVPGSDLPNDHVAWDLQARYLAAGCVTLTATWSPDLILLGGGVAQNPVLIQKVRQEFSRLAGVYWNLPPVEQYLQTAGLDQQAGIVGALCLAEELI
jgi:fructokinase